MRDTKRFIRLHEMKTEMFKEFDDWLDKVDRLKDSTPEYLNNIDGVKDIINSDDILFIFSVIKIARKYNATILLSAKMSVAVYVVEYILNNAGVDLNGFNESN